MKLYEEKEKRAVSMCIAWFHLICNLAQIYETMQLHNREKLTSVHTAAVTIVVTACYSC
jgi:hypothetical protein